MREGKFGASSAGNADSWPLIGIPWSRMSESMSVFSGVCLPGVSWLRSWAVELEPRSEGMRAVGQLWNLPAQQPAV